MQALILLHRWLGVAFCMPFAMWFASGIVMHFVPFPAMTEAVRFAALAPIDPAGVAHGPAEAAATSGIANPTRVRLIRRRDGEVYLVSDGSRIVALRAADLSSAAVRSPSLAASIAAAAGRHDLDAVREGRADLLRYDQWTMAGEFDPYRPLYRIALRDGRGTELYVSSVTGEIVLKTTRSERLWNYAGSIAHWIYPTALRAHRTMWQRLLWGLSLAALIVAAAGATLGILRAGNARLASPYRGWQKLHYWLGLSCMLFVLSWIFSGFLSMDDGLLFSTGRPSDAETAALEGVPAWSGLASDGVQRIASPAKEIEWFAFGGEIYRRERNDTGRQRLVLAEAASGLAVPGVTVPSHAFLQSAEIDAASAHLAHGCNAAVAVSATDSYRAPPSEPGAPVYRVVCGEAWFDIDDASGAVLQKLDRSRRAYRWLFEGLHTLDFPVLMARPALRTALIVGLCALGFLFSLTGIVIGWRRLRSPRTRPT